MAQEPRIMGKNFGQAMRGPVVNLYSILEDFAKIDAKSNTHANNFKFDNLGFPIYRNLRRMMDHLEYGAFPSKPAGYNFSASDRSYKVNPFRFLAYQKIYQDHFFDSRYENPDVTLYNVDQFTTSYPTMSTEIPVPSFSNIIDGSSSATDSQNLIKEMFSMRYAKYNRDFLSNINPSPLFISQIDNRIKAYVGSRGVTGDPIIGGTLPIATVYSSDTAVGISAGVVGGTDSYNSIASAAAMRNLFALDKMAQISSRADKDYKSQMLAHMGYAPRTDSHESVFCGGFTSNLDTTAVVATSAGTLDNSGDQGSFNAFGEQGGFIDNRSSGHITHDCDDFGVFIVLSWISLDSRYDNNGISPFNTKMYKEEYFKPETEDLGMQPNYKSYLNLFNRWEVGIGADKLVKDDVYAWCPRYSEYKTTFDKIHGDFRENESLSFLTTHRPLSTTNHFPTILLGDAKADLSFIMISPSCTDAIVDVVYNGIPKTDPFRVETMFNASFIRDMSVSGLPRI